MSESLSNSTFPVLLLGDAPTIVSETERRRLEAVKRYAILDTPSEGAFDRITRLAAQLLDAPIAIASIIDHDRIWFKSAHGLGGIPEIPREPGLCSTAIEQDEPYVLADASRDPRSKNNSLVSGPFALRFYAGVPLRTNDGFNLGTLCVVDRVPREIEFEKIEMLETLAKVVVDELELRLAARRLAADAANQQDALAHTRSALEAMALDPATELPNRRALDSALDEYYTAFLRGESLVASLAVVDVQGVAEVNRRRGRDVGDRLLRAFALGMTEAFAGHQVFRYGGTEFVVLAASDVAPEAIRKNVRAALDSVREMFPETAVFCGVAKLNEVDGSPRIALRVADSRMYAEKTAIRS